MSNEITDEDLLKRALFTRMLGENLAKLGSVVGLACAWGAVVDLAKASGYTREKFVEVAGKVWDA